MRLRGGETEKAEWRAWGLSSGEVAPGGDPYEAWARKHLEELGGYVVRLDGAAA